MLAALLAATLALQAEDIAPQPEVLAVVAERLSLQRQPCRQKTCFDYEFRAHYRILQVVAGTYEGGQIEFRVFDHYGSPDFAEFPTVLLYLSRVDGDWIHEKYLFNDVYRTADGRWASCGDPYRREWEGHRGAVQAEPVTFEKPLVFPLTGLTEEEIAQKYPEAYYERKGATVVCRAGAFAEELFAIKRDGVLKARARYR